METVVCGKMPSISKHQENFIPLSVAWDSLSSKPIEEGGHHISSCSSGKIGPFLLWYQENPRHLMATG